MHSDSPCCALLDFLDSLNAGHISYRLRYSQPRTISVDVDLPHARWEVDFFEDGDTYIEKFVREVNVLEAEVWAELQANIGECISESKGAE